MFDFDHDFDVSDRELDLRDEYSATVNVFLHFTVLGLITLATGRPFLFPSLGPSAYLMATGEKARAEGAYHVIGGHAVAVVGGLIAYALLGNEVSAYVVFDQPDPAFSMDLVYLSASATLAMMLTTTTMLVTKTNHAAACATTLIVALGLMGGLEDAAIIVGAVAILWYFHDRVISTLAERFGFKPRDARE
ncbi:HPP family protein [Natronobacterium texcoconense]|uniref:HPP family protein n=1 Tax=Natronobacterium texcoconense TaxID=1095778 RepID=A0A1H0ZFN7_NATTX|nr:HPP family protein [Natronobacterium texcoconense]SDQ25901.1 HPP family protein [Natronobacterium texcoconense]